MAPGKSVVPIADHLEGLIPLRVARDVSVQTHQQRKEALVEEHSVGGDPDRAEHRRDRFRWPSIRVRRSHPSVSAESESDSDLDSPHDRGQDRIVSSNPRPTTSSYVARPVHRESCRRPHAMPGFGRSSARSHSSSRRGRSDATKSWARPWSHPQWGCGRPFLSQLSGVVAFLCRYRSQPSDRSSSATIYNPHASSTGLS